MDALIVQSGIVISVKIYSKQKKVNKFVKNCLILLNSILEKPAYQSGFWVKIWVLEDLGIMPALENSSFW